MSENSLYDTIDVSQIEGLLASSFLSEASTEIQTSTTGSFYSSAKTPSISNSTLFQLPLRDEYQAKLRLLVGVIKKTVGPTSIFGSKKIDVLTAVFSELVLRQLPKSISLPQITPDGEGGLLLVWEGRRTVLATVVGSKIHLLLDPGTRNSTPYENLPISGRVLPPELLAALQAV